MPRRRPAGRGTAWHVAVRSQRALYLLRPPGRPALPEMPIVVGRSRLSPGEEMS